MGKLIVFVIVFGAGYFAGAEVLRFNMAQAFKAGEGAALCAEFQRGR